MVGGGFGVEEYDGEETVRSAELPALVQEIHRIDAIRLYAGQPSFVSSCFPNNLKIPILDSYSANSCKLIWIMGSLRF